MNKKILTMILILATIFIWIGYDIWVYIEAGNAATISMTMFRWAYHAPGVAFLFGILFGHLFFPQTLVLQSNDPNQKINNSIGE